MDLERKSFPFELEKKGLDPEARTFKGYAAVTGNLDDGKDIIDRGAFKKTLQEQGHRVKVFYIHDFWEPIGKPLDLQEVPRSRLPKALQEEWPDATGGLYVHGYISETNRGNDALTLMRDKVLDELSIGYEVVKAEELEDGPDGEMVRHLKEIKLMDVSPVPLAMNPAAIVTDVKDLVAAFAAKEDAAWMALNSPTEGYAQVRINFDKDGNPTGGVIMPTEDVEKVAPLLKEAMERHDKELDRIIENAGEATGGFFAFNVDEDTWKKIIEADIQGAEIQKTEIEALGE